MGQGEQKIKYGNEQVYCESCMAMTAPEPELADAVERWNTRHTAAPTAAAMRAALEHYADERNWQRLSRPTTVANVLIRGGNGYDIAQAALASPPDKREDYE